MQIKLSILIPSTHSRWDNFNLKIQEQVFGQYNALSLFDQSRVEILMLVDNKKAMLGVKRNDLVNLAQGEYIVFVDSDDIIAPDYIKTLLDACETGKDVITFTSMVSLNGGKAKPCYYSKDFKRDYNTNNAYYRIPNHICCVKKEVSLKSSFPALKYAEDVGYAKLLLPHLKTEHKIDRVLYYYNYSDTTTETQEHLTPPMRRRKQPAIVDIVILSKATTSTMARMTQQAIDSAIAGANSLPVNIIVVESVGHVRYNNAQTIYHDTGNNFCYNANANLGARQGQSEWIMIANSDLIFKSGWLHHLLIANNPVVSPKCPNDIRQKDIKANAKGDVNAVHFSGWCFMIKRDLWQQIGGFDERVNFWASDDCVIEQVKQKGILPMIVPDSEVVHLGSTTFKTVPRERWDDMTWKDVYEFNKNYNKNKFNDNPNFKLWKQKNKLL